MQVEVNQDSQEPSDMLTPAALDWVKSVGSSATSVTDILEPGDRAVLQAIQRGIDMVNNRATSNAQKIQKWSLLPKDFSIPGGELGKADQNPKSLIIQGFSDRMKIFSSVNFIVSEMLMLWFGKKNTKKLFIVRKFGYMYVVKVQHLFSN